MEITEKTGDTVTERNVEDDITDKDRSSWSKTLGRRGGRMLERLLR